MTTVVVGAVLILTITAVALIRANRVARREVDGLLRLVDAYERIDTIERKAIKKMRKQAGLR